MDLTSGYWFDKTNIVKARLLYSHKAKIQGRYLVELTIHEVGKAARYPDGIKYGLICIDLAKGATVLMDNHHPKGPHIHIGDEELPYEYIDQDRLIDDFRQLVLERMGVKL